jgi:hypothetical protein
MRPFPPTYPSTREGAPLLVGVDPRREAQLHHSRCRAQMAPSQRDKERQSERSKRCYPGNYAWARQVDEGSLCACITADAAGCSAEPLPHSCIRPPIPPHNCATTPREGRELPVQHTADTVCRCGAWCEKQTEQRGGGDSVDDPHKPASIRAATASQQTQQVAARTEPLPHSCALPMPRAPKERA